MRWYEIVMYVAAFGLFFLMNDQTNWERIYASKGSRTAKWGFMLPLIITLISLVLISYLGVFQRVISGGVEDSQSVLYTFLFARPVRQLSSVSGRMAKMDFTAKCDTRRGDEIGDLARDLNTLSSELDSKIREFIG